MHGLGFLTAPILGDAEIEACLSESAFVAAMGAFEAALAASQAELGIVSVSGARAVQELVQKGLTLEASTLAQGVAEAGVPVPALLATMRADLSDEGREALHWGATSQDVVDTALCLLFRDALDVIEARLGRLIETLKTQSEQYSKTPMLARTRGQLATPITFGLRVATWARPLIELEAELPALRGRALRVQFGGASGSQSVVAPHGAAISAALAERLGLADAPPWFTDRSGMAALAAWLGRLVAALAKMGRDIVEMSRGEVAELRAGASGGSSTMPHKANPVTAEALITAHAAAQGHLSALGAAALHGEKETGARGLSNGPRSRRSLRLPEQPRDRPEHSQPI
ncbi:MAG: lyase family protein [Pseudomonadota bacterium]